MWLVLRQKTHDMIFPILINILVAYAIGIGLLWLSTRILAPGDRKISLLRCFAVAFVLTFLANAARKFLTPIVGDWIILICFVLDICIVMGLFRLGLWRSIVVTLIWYIGMFIAYYCMLRWGLMATDSA
jgi:hypothetical protein